MRASFYLGGYRFWFNYREDNQRVTMRLKWVKVKESWLLDVLAVAVLFWVLFW